MALKWTLMLLSTLAAAAVVAAQPSALSRSLGELAHQRAKRQMTTICVEIEPNGPDESPYIMCKDTDLMKHYQPPSPPPPPSQPSAQRPNNYGNEKFQPTSGSYNDNQYAQPAPSVVNQADNNGYGHGQSYYNSQPSAAPKPTAPAYAGAATQAPEQMPQAYAQEENYAKPTPATQPAQATHPAGNYQSYAPFQAAQKYFQSQPPAAAANYAQPNAATYAAHNDGAPAQVPESASHYGKAPSSAPHGAQTSYDAAAAAAAAAPAAYAPSNVGYGSHAYDAPSQAVGGGTEQQQQQQQQQQSTNPYGHNSNSSPAYASDAAALPIATTPKSYGFPGVPYGSPTGTATAAAPMAKGPGAASPAGTYAPAAAAESPAAAYLNNNGNGASASAAGMQRPSLAYESLYAAPAYRPAQKSRHRAPIDADVLDFPNINFNPAELQTFHQQRGNMMRIPNKEVGGDVVVGTARAAAPRLAAPPRARPAMQQQQQQQQRAPMLMQQARAHSEDPIMNAFYNSLDESASVEIEDPIVSQVYPGYGTPSPSYHPMQNFYPQPQYPVAYPPPSYRPAYNHDAVYSNYAPAAVVSPCAPPPQAYVPQQQQRLSQPCIEASNMGATYAPFAPPSTPYTRDMGLQPIFIALPCYGQQPHATLGSPPQLSNENPMIGSPFGFGLFNPFGFRPWPFGGLLGAATPDNALQPSLAFSNPFKFLGQSKKPPSSTEVVEQSVGEKQMPQEAKETSSSTELPQTEAVVGSSRSLDIHDGDDADVDTSEEATSTDSIIGATTTAAPDKATNVEADAQELGTVLDADSGEDELADNLSANTHLTNAEKAIDGTNEQRGSDLRKRHMAKSFTLNQQKRRYLQKI